MCACVSVGLPYVQVCQSVCLVCMYVGRSTLSVHVCRSVCIACACVWAGLHCVCMCVGLSALCVGRSALCVGRSALCVGRSALCVGRSALCVGRSALCVGVVCANFVNLYEIKLNQIVVLRLHGAGRECHFLFSSAPLKYWKASCSKLSPPPLHTPTHTHTHTIQYNTTHRNTRSIIIVINVLKIMCVNRETFWYLAVGSPELYILYCQS